MLRTRVLSVLLSLIAVTEVVLVTSSDKKEFKGTYWRKWLTVILRGRRKPIATQRQLQGMDGEHEDLVRMAQCRYD